MHHDHSSNHIRSFTMHKQIDSIVQLEGMNQAYIQLHSKKSQMNNVLKTQIFHSLGT